MMDIEWWQSTLSGKWYTRIVGLNGEGIYTSQGYTSKYSAIRSAKRVRGTLQFAQIVKRMFGSDIKRKIK
jgi:uncharacterized protein YegP (UPF0339 family)